MMKRVLLVISHLFRNMPLSNRDISFFLIRTPVFIFLFSILATLSAQAQTVTVDTAYQRVVKERVVKIVNKLQLTDSARYAQAVRLISQQYQSVNAIHDQNKITLAAIKGRGLSKEETEALVKKQEDSKSAQLLQLHQVFVRQLEKGFTADQVEKIKDGMTNGILPVTWAAYLDMLPSLTEEQKKQMYAWLLEARELAMDAESSDKKHAVFGKYKGRINNYLSAAGIDMKKEGEEWQKRIRAREAAKKNTAAQ